MSLFVVKSISRHSSTAVAASRRSLSSAAALELSDQTARCIELEERYGAHNYHPLPVVLASGKGMCIVVHDFDSSPQGRILTQVRRKS